MTHMNSVNGSEFVPDVARLVPIDFVARNDWLREKRRARTTGDSRIRRYPSYLLGFKMQFCYLVGCSVSESLQL